MPTSIMETINSSLNAYGKLIQSQTPSLHEMSKIKIFDYQAIFLTLRNAKKPNVNPRFIDIEMKLPVLKYVKDPSNKFANLF